MKKTRRNKKLCNNLVLPRMSPHTLVFDPSLMLAAKSVCVRAVHEVADIYMVITRSPVWSN